MRPADLSARLARSGSAYRDLPAATFLILPALAGVAIFQWLPIGVGVWQSLLHLNPLNPALARFAGGANYEELIADDRFRAAFVNTVLYVIGIVGIEIPIGLALALLLNQGLHGTAVARTAIMAAFVASETVIALLWNLMYTPGNGIFNVILTTVHLPGQPFLTSAQEALPSIIVMAAWKDIGLTVLILLAGLQSIPREYHESAALDGAGRLNQLRYITIPQLRRSLLLALFMSTIAGTRVFTPILLTTQGGPSNASVSLIYYSYEAGFQNLSTGAASASVVIMIIFLAAVTVGEVRLVRAEA
jgi:ABC-type sugar transport system permease subunit